MKKLFVATLLLSFTACDDTYTTREVCLDADMNLMVRETENVRMYLRDIYDDEDSCEENGGTWYWECKESGAHHPIADDEYGLYNQGESNQDVCPQ